MECSGLRNSEINKRNCRVDHRDLHDTARIHHRITVPQLKLFSRKAEDSHGIRIALAEKGIACSLQIVDQQITEPELLWLNDHTDFPVLIDHHVVLFEPRIILEYIDETFPAPPLMPIEPTSRAHCRMLLREIPSLKNTDLPELDRAIGTQDFYLGKHYSLVDTSITPFLATQHKQLALNIFPRLKRYTETLMTRKSFKKSLAL